MYQAHSPQFKLLYVVEATHHTRTRSECSVNILKEFDCIADRIQ